MSMAEDSDDIQALEYALGLLDEDARRAFEAALLDDRELATKVWAWEDQLLPLAEAVKPRPLGPRVLREVERRIFGKEVEERRADKRAISFWRRSFSLASVVALIALGAIATIALRPELVVEPQPQWVAAIIYENGSVTLARLREDGTLVAEAARPLTGNGSQELWIVPAGGPPLSLGLMPEEASGEMHLTREADLQFAPGSELRITLEPVGGSPTGAPTGPLVASGPLSYI
ncbi:anti-sigma factor [Acuticoccus kandeliae]|uniref:anti-sigma factor n=1 Tax=Acuticoccus kandeliae TaxID=2073160 RepID=UPI0013002D56|nr:anti-sigma factor [Acuticoccus kandeliae]